jgi:hypothetical protein
VGARRAISCVLCVLAVSAGGPARAEEKKACFEAYERGQRLRRASELRASAKELSTCAREACPAMIRKECSQWLEEVDNALPSLIFAVTGPDGHDVTDVKVSMDGEVLVTSLSATAVPVDPGAHRFRFEREGLPTIEQEHVIREGEKLRRLSASFATGQEPAEPVGPAPSDRAEPTTRPTPMIVYVLGGVGVAALGGFGFFALSGVNDKRKLEACRPFCSKDDIDANKRTFLLADVFLGLGVVSIGAAAVLFFTRPEAAVRSALLAFDAVPAPGGGLVTFRGSL